MQHLKLTKQHVIDGILNEPLIKGQFIVSKERFVKSSQNPLCIDYKFADGQCPVSVTCAMLRQAGVADKQIISWRLFLHLECIPEIEALSRFYNDCEWTTRKELLNFAQEVIPDSWCVIFTKNYVQELSNFTISHRLLLERLFGCDLR